MKKFLTLFLLISASTVLGQRLSEHEINWLKNNVVSFQKDIGDTPFEELRKIEIPDIVKVIGLGEANHGTKQFQDLKHKLALYLIHEHKFNKILIEFPYSHGLLLNEYVTGKNQSGLKILTGQENSEYNNRDFINFIEDIKKLNTSLAQSLKIQFLGVDIFGKPYALGRLMKYFSKISSPLPKELKELQYLTENLSLSAFKQDTKEFKQASKISEKYLIKNKKALIEISSILEYERMLRLSELLAVKWKGNQRAKEWHKSILLTMNEDKINRILFLGHNLHISKFKKDVGAQLDESLGEQYFAIGTDYYSGAFNLKNLQDRNHIVFDKIQILPMDSSFAFNISNLEGRFHYLKFPSHQTNLTSWLFTPNFIARTGFGYLRPFTSPEQFKELVIIPRQFDAVIVFDTIQPSELLENDTPLNNSHE